eukprot:jgi/Phyca11/99719/e_gw1.4.1195.1
MQAPHASSPSAPVPTKIRRGRGSDNLLQELRHLVSGGDYGDTTYLLHEIDKRMRGSRDRYIDGGFSLSFAVKSQAAALVFRNACDDVAGFRRVWNDDNYDEEKKIFLENLPKTDKRTKAQLRANAK